MIALYAPAEITNGLDLCNHPQRLLDAANGDTSKLIDCLVWSTTPQGHDHWSDIYDGRNVLTDADRVYLAELYVEMMREEDALS